MVKETNDGLQITIKGSDIENSIHLQRAIIRMIRNNAQAIASDCYVDRSNYGTDMYHITKLLEGLIENYSHHDVLRVLNDVNEKEMNNEIGNPLFETPDYNKQ